MKMKVTSLLSSYSGRVCERNTPPPVFDTSVCLVGVNAVPTSFDI